MRYFIFCLFNIISLHLFSQNVENRYAQYLVEGGRLYFFKPHKLSETEGVSGFTYDATYTTLSDSVRINFSLIKRKSASVSKVVFCNGDIDITVDRVSVIYRDANRKGFEIRSSLMVTYLQFKQIMSNPVPLILKFYFTDGTVASARYTQSQWRKEHKLLETIFSAIDTL